MSTRIDPLAPGEELTSPEGFFALLSGRAGGEAPAPAAADRDAALLALGLHPPRQCAPAPAAVRTAPAPVPSGRPASPAAAAALEAEIDRCAEREHVSRLAVHLARAYASAAAFFVVRRGSIEGVCGEGLGARREGLLVSTDAPSLFTDVAARAEPYRGAPPADAVTPRILRALRRPAAVREIAVLPVGIRGRTVALLYADNGPEALGDAALAALQTVCARVARAYERILVARKRRPLAARGSGASW